LGPPPAQVSIFLKKKKKIFNLFNKGRNKTIKNPLIKAALMVKQRRLWRHFLYLKFSALSSPFCLFSLEKKTHQTFPGHFEKNPPKFSEICPLHNLYPANPAPSS
jgi:hypothetical protein